MRIIVPTCHKYLEHIAPVFTKAVRRAWPDFPWPMTMLLANETGKPYGLFTPLRDTPRFRVVYTVDHGWASNLLNFLGDSDEPFLLLLDDYILDVVDHRLLELAVQAIELSTVGMVRVHPCPGPTLDFPFSPELGEIDKREPYAISLQAAIWKPQVIRDLFRHGEDPWQTEIDGSRRAAGYSGFHFLGTKASAIGYRELMKRGQVVPETQAWCEANL